MRKEALGDNQGFHMIAVGEGDSRSTPKCGERSPCEDFGFEEKTALPGALLSSSQSIGLSSRGAVNMSFALFASFLLAGVLVGAFGGALFYGKWIQRNQHPSKEAIEHSNKSALYEQIRSRRSASPAEETSLIGAQGPSANAAISQVLLPFGVPSWKGKQELSSSTEHVPVEGEMLGQENQTEDGSAVGDKASDVREKGLAELRSLTSAMKALELAWSASSRAVQAAFKKNYMPNSGGAVADPLLCLQQHGHSAEKALGLQDFTSDPNEDAVMDAFLVRTVLEAALRRLWLLCEIEKLCDTWGIGSQLLGREPAPLPRPDILRRAKDQVTFEDFTGMLRGFPFHVPSKALEEAGTVPRVLAERLAASVKAETLQLENDRLVHSGFQRFALSLQSDSIIKHPNSKEFSVSVFLKFLGRATMDREANTLTPQVLGSWVTDWNVDGVLSRLVLNVEEAEEVLQLRPANHLEDSAQDILAVAVALI
ncbi:hypothetical protein, conserved [Eimeria tenella]|uniref:Transmembrane protein n=1 Tax=Eimeria tenella TaxID=5802 RepID=U6KRG9_EIMTE|nr:hypothetical protein, conserved [Eimeria tenella]CDJ40566.1 hypothetical protein, conserved [Eimeria tenella]|eukprot:XP_013231316.1 hypothetical protein, conserved [Eimeria tenella]